MRRNPVITALVALVVAWSATAALSQSEDLTRTHAYSYFGEPRYGADFEHLDYVNPDAPRGGEMSFAWSSGIFDSVHPYTRQGRPAVLASIFYEAMLTGTADEIGTSYCLLCAEMAYPEDLSYVIFTLRENVRFSDGTPVTADDVLFSYEVLRDEGLPSFRASIPRTVAGAEVLDDRRIRFDFVEDSPRRVRIGSAGGLPVFSRASHEESGLAFSDPRLDPLIGSGPYMLGEVVSGQRVVYERNADYWGDDLPINVGRNNFDAIRIEYYGDATAAFEGFTAGNYLFRQENSSVTWATSYDFPALDAGTVLREELPDGTIASGQSFVMNIRRPQLRDPRVREAIALMFNFDWTNATLFFGLYSPIDSFWENTDLEATGLPSEAELAVLEPYRGQIPDEVFTEEPFTLPTGDADTLFDRSAARRAINLLTEAGWSPGEDGLMQNADGETLQVEFLNSSPLFDRIINPYVENLRQIGVDARLSRVDNAQMVARERAFDFDVITDHYPMDYEPGTSLRQYFGEASEDSIFNPAGISSDGLSALVEDVIAADTQEELEVRISALDRVLRAYRFRVPQWFNDSHWVSYYDIYRYPEELPPYSLGFLDFWWYDAEAAARLAAEGAL